MFFLLWLVWHYFLFVLQITSGCQKGTTSFNDLYEQAKAQEGSVIERCKVEGEPYTTEEMFRQALEEQGKTENLNFYTENCKMNNAILQQAVCNWEKTEELTEEQQTTIRNDKCAESETPKLNANDIEAICIYKLSNIETSMIFDFLSKEKDGLTQDDIVKAMATCPGSSETEPQKRRHLKKHKHGKKMKT